MLPHFLKMSLEFMLYSGLGVGLLVNLWIHLSVLLVNFVSRNK